MRRSAPPPKTTNGPEAQARVGGRDKERWRRRRRRRDKSSEGGLSARSARSRSAGEAPGTRYVSARCRARGRCAGEAPGTGWTGQEPGTGGVERPHTHLQPKTRAAGRVCAGAACGGSCGAAYSVEEAASSARRPVMRKVLGTACAPLCLDEWPLSVGRSQRRAGSG